MEDMLVRMTMIPRAKRKTMEWCLVILLLVSTCSAKVTISPNGGYEGVTVAFHGDINKPCTNLIENLKVIMGKSSNILYSATRKRSFFKEINVILPPTWNSSFCNVTISPSQSMSWKTADIRIGQTHPLFRDTIWTQQSEGCGKRGDFISTSYNFLQPNRYLNYSDVGQDLVREWAKYRYGVFDESGFLNDDVYPPTYYNGTDYTPNLCSNNDLWTCNNPDDPTSCLNTVKSGYESYNPKSSVLSGDYLPSAKDFCDDNTHKNGIPTKQNGMCQGRSTMEVIFGNSDFKEMNKVVAFAEPVFKFFVPQRPRIVILIENTQHMDTNDIWRYLTSSLSQLIMKDLPLDTEVGVVSFNSQATVVQPMTVLKSDSERSQVYASIYSINVRRDNIIVDLSAAVNRGITELKLDSKEQKGSVLLILTSGRLSSQNINESIRTINNYGVRAAVIECPSKGGSVKSIAEQVDGIYYLVQDRRIGSQSSLETFINLLDVFIGVLDYFTPVELGGNPVLVYEKKIDAGERNETMYGSFIIDDESLNNSEMFIYQYSLQPSHIPRKNVTSPSGRSYTKFLPVTASSADTVLADFNEMGVWSYQLQRSITNQPQFVRVTSKAVASYGNVYVRFYTSAINQKADVKDTPLILYAEVKMNELPVLNAKVVVRVETPGNTTYGFTKLIDLELSDNGSGDPDVTANDGIYSKYLTNFGRVAGIFRFSVSVIAEDGAYTVRARGKRSFDDEYATITTRDLRCCGSKVDIPNNLHNEIQLERFIQDITLDIEKVPQNENTYKPGRIGDFRAVLHNQSTLKFQWTATGGNYDSGKVKSYTIRYSDDPNILYNNFTSAPELTSTGWYTDRAGEGMEVSANVPQHNKLYYYAIAAENNNSISGTVSNIMSVYAFKTIESTTGVSSLGQSGTDGTDLNSATSSQSNRQNRLIIVVVGILGSLILIALVLILFFYCCVYRKKKKQQEAYAASAANLNGGIIREQVDVNTLSLNNVNGSNAAIDESNGTISVISDGKSLISPVQSWSASQLLGEHEKRQSPYGHTEGLVITDENGLYGHYPTDYYTATLGHYYPTEEIYYDEYGRLVQRDSISKASNFESSHNSPENTVHSDSFISAVSRPRVQQGDYETCIESDGEKQKQYTNNIYESNKKIPPPTLPKPTVNGHNGGLMAYNVNLQGSLTSVNSDRKRRNITQV